MVEKKVLRNLLCHLLKNNYNTKIWTLNVKKNCAEISKNFLTNSQIFFLNTFGQQFHLQMHKTTYHRNAAKSFHSNKCFLMLTRISSFLLLGISVNIQKNLERIDWKQWWWCYIMQLLLSDLSKFRFYCHKNLIFTVKAQIAKSTWCEVSIMWFWKLLTK